MQDRVWRRRLLVPHVTYPQPSSVSTTAMMDTPLTAQTCIHQTATHPKPLSIFLLSLTMAQAQPRNARILLLPHPTPHQAALSSGDTSWCTRDPASPPLSEHHWEGDPMNCSTPGLAVHHQLLEFTQTHVHRVSDAIQCRVGTGGSGIPFFRGSS